MFSTSPLERLERALSPWVAYVVVPVFALANAGVALSGDAIGGLVSDPVTLGVLLGLVVGKTVGVFSSTAIAVKLGVGRLPAGHHLAPRARPRRHRPASASPSPCS